MFYFLFLGSVVLPVIGSPLDESRTCSCPSQSVRPIRRALVLGITSSHATRTEVDRWLIYPHAGVDGWLVEKRTCEKEEALAWRRPN